jgi:hypothetical protein
MTAARLRALGLLRLRPAVLKRFRRSRLRAPSPRRSFGCSRWNRDADARMRVLPVRQPTQRDVARPAIARADTQPGATWRFPSKTIARPMPIDFLS